MPGQGPNGRLCDPTTAARDIRAAAASFERCPTALRLADSGLVDRENLPGVGLAEFRLAVAVDEGARLNRDVLVDHVTAHPCCRRQDDLLGFDLAIDGSRELDRLAIDGALHLRIAADLHVNAAHIAIDLAFDLDVLGALELAGDLEGFADDGD